MDVAIKPSAHGSLIFTRHIHSPLPLPSPLPNPVESSPVVDNTKCVWQEPNMYTSIQRQIYGGIFVITSDGTKSVLTVFIPNESIDKNKVQEVIDFINAQVVSVKLHKIAPVEATDSFQRFELNHMQRECVWLALFGYKSN